MRKARWGAAAAVALTTCVPFVAEAATPPSPQTPTSPTKSTATGTATGTATQARTTVSGATAPRSTPVQPAPSTQPVRSQQTAQQTTVTQPAPPGSSEAYAAQVGNIAAVSHTKASASGSGESSTANPLEIGGNPPAAAFGGSKSGPGSDSGALLDTGKTPLGRLALTPWAVKNSSSASGNSASGLADIVWLDLGDPSTQQSVSLRVLQSESNAQWTPAASTGNSSSDGAILDVGGPSGLAVDVLHSETSSSGAGSSYLLSINGNQIGSSSQANGKCAISVPGVLTLNCLTASGGTGANGVLSSAAGVADATVGPANSGLTAALIQSKGTSGKAPGAAVTPAATSPAAGAPATAPAASAPASGAAAAAPAEAAKAPSTLPMTGANIGLLAAAALLLGGAGTGIVLMSRRPRAATRR